MFRGGKKRGKKSRKGSSRKRDGSLLRQNESAIMQIVEGWGTFGRRPVRPEPGAQLTTRQIVPGNLFSVTTGLTSDSIVTTQLVDQSVALAFELQDLPQAASFSALFDQYRFEKVVLHVVSQENVSSASSTVSAQGINPLAVVVDYDDSTALGSMNAALEYDQVQVLQPYQSARIELRPNLAPAYYQSGVFSGYGVTPSRAVWLDSASAAIRHFGVKAYVSASGSTTANAAWKVWAEYFVSFKCTR